MIHMLCLLQLMEELLKAVMIEYKGVPLPDVAVKLRNLLGAQQLPADGLLHDGIRSVGRDLRIKPLIVDLPWVVDAFADGDKLPRIDITDRVLDSVAKYLKHSTTTAGMSCC